LHGAIEGEQDRRPLVIGRGSVMPGGVVIIVPTQGFDTGSFEDVAKKLSREVYHGNATIVRTTISGSGGSFAVAFTTLKGEAFSWEDAHDLSSVLTVSHGASCDGPNLAYSDSGVEEAGHQPWGSEGGTCTELSEAGKSFWKLVGQALRSDGKIILVGCSMGSGSYAGLVAAVTGKRVYASTSSLGAGDASTSLKYVRALERGRVLAPMKQYEP
jgi:hypothetical protein